MVHMTKTILIVEDNELNTKLFVDVLAARGHRTVTSVDGLDAVRLTRDEGVDLILMDMKLPLLSGLDVAKFVKAQDDLQKVPIVALTGSVEAADRRAFLEGGCAGHIAKPIDIVGFAETVERFLELGVSAAAPA